MKYLYVLTFDEAFGTNVYVPSVHGSGWLSRMFTDIAAYWKRGRDYELLLEMPDHVLDDIGLDRCTVREAQFRHRRHLWGWRR
ncbi:hypothetical protein [Roseibium sp. MMSF_3544]|uniref:hypothetical protein n=1 Tax=unclassified Roseibium TaxID=2629323 RepID=UPI00273E71F5|nr:hypothetical protein [Roseibium sp. MMSF_3544]